MVSKTTSTSFERVHSPRKMEVIEDRMWIVFDL